MDWGKLAISHLFKITVFTVKGVVIALSNYCHASIKAIGFTSKTVISFLSSDALPIIHWKCLFYLYPPFYLY